MRLLALVLCAVLGLAGCRSTLAFEARCPHGVARADEPQVAIDLARMGSEFAPLVCRELGVQGDEPFVIEYRPRQPAAGLYVARNWRGRVTERLIEIGEEAMRKQARYTVAHELVHWYAQGEWDRLPHAIEEGLANHIAIQCVPEFAAPFLRHHEGQLATETPELRARALALGPRDWSQASEATKDVAYAVGFEIASALGVDGLRALCVRATAEDRDLVPIAWIDEAIANARR